MPGEFYIGKHRVIESDHGFWIYPNDRPRGRFYAFGTPIADSIRNGHKEVDPEKTERAFKPGTHEPIFYLRDEHGKVGIPPEPGLPIPTGCTLHEAKSLQEIDAITREMNIDLHSQFYDDGTATRYLDAALGNPIETLKEQLRNPISRMERDVIPLLIEELEDMERKNRRVETSTRFYSRER